ncbi:MAG: antibiotic biosynthesis monooxygenase [Planctomycetes bacterium]|nr:antibiotic biosynthesis monooxygenase [Planctomycetota bacterium]
MSFIRIASFLAILTSIVPTAAGQDKVNPIEAEVKANLKDLKKPFTMLVIVKIKEGAAEKFESAFVKARVATRKEKGNKAYSLNRSTKAPNEYFVYERWDNFAALQKHLKAPHITALLADIGDLLDGPPQVKVFLPIRE